MLKCWGLLQHDGCLARYGCSWTAYPTLCKNHALPLCHPTHLCTASPPPRRPAPAEAQAACAAHVAAAGVLAGMAAAAVSANGGSAGQDVGPALVDLASSLWMALRAVPSLAGTAALAPIEALLSALPQVRRPCAWTLPVGRPCNNASACWGWLCWLLAGELAFGCEDVFGEQPAMQAAALNATLTPVALPPHAGRTTHRLELRQALSSPLRRTAS